MKKKKKKNVNFKKEVRKKSPNKKKKGRKISSGYTSEIKDKISKVKKLYKKKSLDQERFEQEQKKFEENKKKLEGDLNRSRSKKNLEQKNLTRLINYLRGKK